MSALEIFAVFVVFTGKGRGCCCLYSFCCRCSNQGGIVFSSASYTDNIRLRNNTMKLWHFWLNLIKEREKKDCREALLI